MTYLIIIICLIISIFDYKKNKELFSPLFIFNAMWAVTLLLYQLKLSYIQSDFTSRTSLIFLLCIISFNVTALLMGKFFKKFKIKEINKKVNKNFISLLNISFILCFIIEIIYSKGFPFLWKLTGSSKTYMDFGITSVHGALNGLAIILCLYYLTNKEEKNRKFKILFYILFAILTLSRQVLMSIFVEFMCVKFYQLKKENKKFSIKKIIAIISVVIISFTILGNFRSGNNIMDNVFRPRKQYKNISKPVMWGYSYLTFSLSNFNNLTTLTDGGVNYGVSNLESFLPSVVTKNLNIHKNVDINYLVSPAFTVSTYLPDTYLDFGITGIIVLNILISIITSIFYNKMKKGKYNYYYILLYSICIHNIVFMFFINMWIYLPIFIQFIYLLFMFKTKKNADS